MATHSSTLAWKIPWMEEPGRLQSMGSLRVGHDWATSLSLFMFMHWRRKWQPTPVFLPGESQGQGSLVDCRLWGRTELATTEVTAAALVLHSHHVLLSQQRLHRLLLLLETWPPSPPFFTYWIPTYLFSSYHISGKYSLTSKQVKSSYFISYVKLYASFLKV